MADHAVIELALQGLLAAGLFLASRRRREPSAPRRRGPGIVARRHVQATYRAWARRAGWIAADDAWTGTVRGVEAKLSPHLEDDVPDDVTLRLAMSVSRAAETSLTASDGEKPHPDLAPLFADGTLLRLAWTTEHLDLCFAPLTDPEIVLATGETVLAALQSSEMPYR